MTHPLHRLFNLILLVMLCVCFTGCKTLDGLLAGTPKPSASLVGVQLDSLSWNKMALKFDVEVTNPYSLPLPLVNMDYGLSGMQSQLLSGKAVLEGSIPANASKRVTLPAEVTLAEVVKFVQGVRPGNSLPYAATLNLSVDAPQFGPITIPLSRQGELQVPNLPGLSSIPGF